MEDLEFQRMEGEAGWNGESERKRVAVMRKIVEKANPDSKVHRNSDLKKIRQISPLPSFFSVSSKSREEEKLVILISYLSSIFFLGCRRSDAPEIFARSRSGHRKRIRLIPQVPEMEEEGSSSGIYLRIRSAERAFSAETLQFGIRQIRKPCRIDLWWSARLLLQRYQ